LRVVLGAVFEEAVEGFDERGDEAAVVVVGGELRGFGDEEVVLVSEKLAERLLGRGGRELREGFEGGEFGFESFGHKDSF
jgi:hypothetical protein